MPAVFEGKKVLLVDDSIVRGTAMSQIVEMVRRAGAVKAGPASPSCPCMNSEIQFQRRTRSQGQQQTGG